MADFIATKGAAHYIEQILTGATDRLTLVSPYLKLSDVFLLRLQGAAKRGVPITLVHREDELQPAEREKLRSVETLRLLGLGSLHAKCYANEHEMVITSMNLYSSSEQNWEMGVRAAKGDPVYEAAMREVEAIVAAGTGSSRVGHCIRCGTQVRYDPARPLCISCYDIWSMYRSAEYIEGVCHGCGQDAPTSMGSPLCGDCVGPSTARASRTRRQSHC